VTNKMHIYTSFTDTWFRNTIEVDIPSLHCFMYRREVAGGQKTGWWIIYIESSHLPVTTRLSTTGMPKLELMSACARTSNRSLPLFSIVCTVQPWPLINRMEYFIYGWYTPVLFFSSLSLYTSAPLFSIVYTIFFRVLVWSIPLEKPTNHKK